MNFISLGKRKNMAVLFLHGWGGSIQSFYGASKKLSEIGFFTILVDFPGHGGSPEPECGYSVFDYAKRLDEFITSLNIKEIIVVAHSFGARVAVKLLGFLKPQNYSVLKLVLVGAAGIKPRRGLLYKAKIQRYKKLKIKVQEGKKSAKLLERFGSSDYKNLSPIMKESFVKVVNEDLGIDASNIKTETLIIYGKKDKETPLYMAKKYNKLIENSLLKIYNTGHYCYIDEKERFFDDLYCFFVTR